MKREVLLSRIKLGIFVIVAFSLITALIFYIGSNQHKFGARKKIHALFEEVSGLNQGNPVRFQGVTIGVVEEVQIISDSLVKVVMVIDSEAGKFIKQDSEASILTEGVLGSKFVSISSGSIAANRVENEGKILSNEPQDFDDLVAALTETSVNAKSITRNLDNITKKIDEGEGTLGTLISDKTLLTKVETLVSSFEAAGKRTYVLTGKLSHLVDTLEVAGGNAVTASGNVVEASENFVEFSEQLNNPEGPLQKLIGDTVLAEKMETSVENVNQAAKDIGQTSCRIRNHWFMRLFAKKDKEVAKNP